MLADHGAWLWDVRTGAVQWTDELYHVSGLDPSDFAGTVEGHLGAVHVDDRDDVRDAMEGSREGRSVRDPMPHRAAGRIRREVEVRGVPAAAYAGTIVGLAAPFASWLRSFAVGFHVELDLHVRKDPQQEHGRRRDCVVADVERLPARGLERIGGGHRDRHRAVDLLRHTVKGQISRQLEVSPVARRGAPKEIDRRRRIAAGVDAPEESAS